MSHSDVQLKRRNNLLLAVKQLKVTLIAEETAAEKVAELRNQVASTSPCRSRASDKLTVGFFWNALAVAEVTDLKASASTGPASRGD